MNCAYYEALMQVQQQTIAVIRRNALYRHKNNESALEALNKNQVATPSGLKRAARINDNIGKD